MIRNIEETIDGETLTVKVTCHIRKFAIHQINILTTEQVIDNLKEKHKILEVIKSPSKVIGNSKRRKMSNCGTWVFKIQQKEEKIEKAKPKRPRKAATTPKTKQTSSKNSIRGRMSKLASKKD